MCFILLKKIGALPFLAETRVGTCQAIILTRDCLTPPNPPKNIPNKASTWLATTSPKNHKGGIIFLN